MIKKIIFILILGIVTSSCGFSPIYSSKSDNLMNINLVSADGDIEINRGIKSKLRIHKNLSSQVINVKLETTTKKDLSKNNTGKIQNYQLVQFQNLY